jgi:hypothetical protein
VLAASARLTLLYTSPRFCSRNKQQHNKGLVGHLDIPDHRLGLWVAMADRANELKAPSWQAGSPSANYCTVLYCTVLYCTVLYCMYHTLG